MTNIRYSRLYSSDTLPRIDPYEEGYYGKDIKDADDIGCCTVVTLACVTGINYFKCKKFCEKYGRQHRRGMTEHQIDDMMKGFTKFKVVKGEYGNNNRITLNQFLKRHPCGKFYLCHRGHAFAVIDGVIYDHTEGKRRQITQAYRFYNEKDLKHIIRGKV